MKIQSKENIFTLPQKECWNLGSITGAMAIRDREVGLVKAKIKER